MHPCSPLQCKHLASFGHRGGLLIIYILPQDDYYITTLKINITLVVYYYKVYYGVCFLDRHSSDLSKI